MPWLRYGNNNKFMEKYNPSQGEIKKAESMMSDEQRVMSLEREREHFLETLNQMEEGEYKQRCMELVLKLGDVAKNIQEAASNKTGGVKFGISSENLEQILSQVKYVSNLLSGKSPSDIMDGTGEAGLKFNNEPLSYRVNSGQEFVEIPQISRTYEITEQMRSLVGDVPRNLSRLIWIPEKLWSNGFVPSLEGDAKNYETAQLVVVKGKLDNLIRSFKEAKNSIGYYQKEMDKATNELAKDCVENPETYSILKKKVWKK